MLCVARFIFPPQVNWDVPLNYRRKQARVPIRAKHTRAGNSALVCVRLLKREDVPYSDTPRINCALMATITVLADITAAPTAGPSVIPIGASTPIASGIAITL